MSEFIVNVDVFICTRNTTHVNQCSWHLRRCKAMITLHVYVKSALIIFSWRLILMHSLTGRF